MPRSYSAAQARDAVLGVLDKHEARRVIRGDTPGMRELQLTDVHSGRDEVFADIVTLANSCRFNSCQHETEPDCAVQGAVSSGNLDADRLKRWRKLVAEEAYITESLAERRSRDKAFGKMVKRVMKDKKQRQ